MHGVSDGWLLEFLFNALLILSHPMAAVAAVCVFMLFVLTVVVYYLRNDVMEDNSKMGK